MGRIRALPLLLALLAAALLVSGASGADPRTPPALPGHAAPFLGTSLLGDGGLTAAVDDYGDVVDLRLPGPAGEAQIANPFARQAAGSVRPLTGVVPAVAIGAGPARPLWEAASARQRYLAGTNVLRTRARIEGSRVLIEDAATGQGLVRRFTVRARPVEPVAVRLSLNLVPSSRFRCRGRPDASSHTVRGIRSMVWRGRGTIRAALVCGKGESRRSGSALIRKAAARDRRWLARSRPLGAGAPSWARRMYGRSLLVLRALTDRRSGAAAAAARDRWAYVWPRDAGTAAIALAASGHRPLARRIARFLSGLDLGSGARFRGDGSPVADGRALAGDASGWVAAAARAARIAARSEPRHWRQRGDYGERDGDVGDYLANAIAAGTPAAEIERLFATRRGLVRRASDPGSGLDSAAAWAVRPFARPALYPQARRSLLGLAAAAGRFGLAPSEDWPRRESWTAPAAWSAWSLAALGERRAALRLLGAVRRAATPTGTIPERVKPDSGVARSATPLGWSHAFAVLALHQLYPR